MLDQNISIESVTLKFLWVACSPVFEAFIIPILKMANFIAIGIIGVFVFLSAAEVKMENSGETHVVRFELLQVYNTYILLIPFLRIPKNNMQGDKACSLSLPIAIASCVICAVTIIYTHKLLRCTEFHYKIHHFPCHFQQYFPL